MQGPNVRKLISAKMAKDAVPSGGGVADALLFLSNPKAIASSAQAATAWVEAAILAVRQAAEPNPWKNADNEAIAGEILRRMNRK